jgi:hypothetical protein
VPELDDLLARGYFPKELPPPFKTVSFAKAVTADVSAYLAAADDVPPTKLAHHNLARPGNLHRRLGIPNPASHLRLCTLIVESWPELLVQLSKSQLSLSTPVDSPAGRTLNTRVPLGDLAQYRAAIRAGQRAVLSADIARFYPALYTHSIPWALHTKVVAKANKGGPLLGNALDKLVRGCQDGQTVGIPIGPDTSLIIAELVMASVDEEIQARLNPVGLRYLDDFEFAFPSVAAAEGALGPLQETLGHTELALNPTKTLVHALPQLSEEQWIPRLREFRIRKKPDQQRRDIVQYFDLAFELARAYPSKTVLNYAVAGLRSVELDESNVGLAHDLILQSIVNEAGVARFGWEMLIRWRAAGLTLATERIALAVDTMIRHHGPLMQGSEVAWALWGAIVFAIELSDDATIAALRMDDPVVALLLLDAAHRGFTTYPVAERLATEIDTDSLGAERWLLLYEGTRRGWLPAKVLAHAHPVEQFFERLADDGVSFYDSDAELSKVDRPLDQLHGLTLPVIGFVFGY